ncbi:MAG TPA: bifunctional diaminohydroxyphosphoribosylaminopyrimidine deaminase/5-amino-6-(5-phosphoribosylamino)uracil reductase RibD [Actinomycetota bacterium]|nr:bifunctional diaminohydroxyphosphoribosylaminopyrimidine deaminase/5-amino-6-(5-phosphoribosylamino)uracil reductase RibD [Actinomycetota bacterium]
MLSRTDTEHDVIHMRRALELASRGLGLAAPNPMVGAVVVAADDVVGEGWHEGPGTVHAEVMALAAAGGRAHGATLYVTLEPCSHVGRTGPCAPAVAEAGIARVVAAIRDPNPKVDGGGFAVLRSSGVEVETGVLAREAEDLIAGFAKHVMTGQPFVVLKLAASLDGKVAAPDGSSRWITGEEARRDGHRLRAASGAVIVGAGTAIADRPQLTVRLDGYRGRQPVRVVVDSSGRTPAEGPLFDGSNPTVVATTTTAQPGAVERWRKRRVEVREFAGDRVPLRALLSDLGGAGIQSALIEGGPTLAAAALEEGVVDRLVVYLAPKLIGGDAPGMFDALRIGTIGEARPLRIRTVERIGDDVKVVADVHRDR